MGGALEAPPVREISVYGGFPYAGGERAEASVAAYADGDVKAAAQAAMQVAQALRERAARFAPRLLAPNEGLRHALAAPAGLVAVTDPADNPYSGGAADTPALFRALLDLRPKVPTVFAYFADAEVVAAAHAAGTGSRLSVTLGGKASRLFGRGVAVTARVQRLAQARFSNSGPMEHGMAVDLGASTVLDVDGIAVIVTTHCGAANDPAFFEAHGIDLAATRLLCVKAKNHFRAAFASRCAAIIDVDCPGPAMANLDRLRRYFERGEPRRGLRKPG